MSNNQKKIELNDPNFENYMKILTFHYEEWKHREEYFWKMSFQFFLASVIIDLFPYTTKWGINLKSVVPEWIFPVLGLFMSMIFLVIGGGFAKRLKAESDTLNKVLKMLPEGFERESILDDKGWWFNTFLDRPISKTIYYTMYMGQFLLSLFILSKYIGG